MLILPLFLLASPDAHREAVIHYGYARWLSGRNQLASAAVELERSRRFDRTAIAPQRDLVRIYAQLGRNAAAMRLAKDVLTANTADAATALTLARLHEFYLEPRQAADVLVKALPGANEPNLKLKVFRGLGSALWDAKDWSAAEDTHRQFLTFITDDRPSLIADGYESADLDREATQLLEQLGRVQTERKQFTQALVALDRAAARHTDEYSRRKIDYDRSQTYAAMNDHARAIAVLEQFLDAGPLQLKVWQWYAELLKQDAEARLEHYIRKHGAVDVIVVVRLTEMARRDFAAAHIQFRELLPKSNSAAVIGAVVQCYVEHQRPRELLAIIEDVFSTDAERPRVMMESLVKYPNIIPSLLKAARDRNGLSPQLWESLGELAERADVDEDLEYTLKQCLKLAVDDPSATAFDRLARAYARQRRWSDLASLCDTTPKLEAVRAKWKATAERRGDKPLSETELRARWESDPDDVSTLNDYAYELANQNRQLADAEAMIRYALELDQRERRRLGISFENGKYLHTLGWVQYRRGDANAKTTLEKAVRLPEGRHDEELKAHLSLIR